MCVSYRNNLRAMLHRKQKLLDVSPSVHATTSSHTNVRYLSTPLRSKRNKHPKARCDADEGKVKRLTENINKLIASRSILVDSGGSYQNYGRKPEQDCRRLLSRDFFWKQQQQALKVKNNRQLRYPMMVKWCLHLKMVSSAAYHAMRSSGFIKLPSEQTLRDYTHLVKAATGIQPDVNAQIIKEAKVDTLEDWRLSLMKLKLGRIWYTTNTLRNHWIPRLGRCEQPAEFSLRCSYQR